MSGEKLPGRIYKVRRVGGAPLHYTSPLGKMYVDLEMAKGRVKAIERDGGRAVLYYADVEWRELTDDDIG